MQVNRAKKAIEILRELSLVVEDNPSFHETPLLEIGKRSGVG